MSITSVPYRNFPGIFTGTALRTSLCSLISKSTARLFCFLPLHYITYFSMFIDQKTNPRSRLYSVSSAFLRSNLYYILSHVFWSANWGNWGSKLLYIQHFPPLLCTRVYITYFPMFLDQRTNPRSRPHSVSTTSRRSSIVLYDLPLSSRLAPITLCNWR